MGILQITRACDGYNILDQMEIECLRQMSDIDFREIDLKEINSKNHLLVKIGKSLGLPPYYAANWDSFEECLSDFNPNNDLLVLLFVNYQAPSIADDLEVLINVVKEVDAEWLLEKQHGEIYIIFAK